MSLYVTLRKDSVTNGVVRYVLSSGKPSFFAGELLLQAEALPDPPPILLHVSLSWPQASRPMEEHEGGPEHAGGQWPRLEAAAGHPRFEPGDVVKVVKSRISGVKNPPDLLHQHLGKTGVVRWTTAGGANVDLGTENVWFAYDELEWLAPSQQSAPHEEDGPPMPGGEGL